MRYIGHRYALRLLPYTHWYKALRLAMTCHLSTLSNGLESAVRRHGATRRLISVLHRTTAASLKHLSTKQDYGSRKLQHQRFLPSSSITSQ